MKRGDIVTIVTQGDYGKPRPAIVVQSDRLYGTDSALVCPMTSTLADASDVRLSIPADQGTGLRAPSFAMVEKITPVQRRKCGGVIGQLPAAQMADLNERLALVIGLAG